MDRGRIGLGVLLSPFPPPLRVKRVKQDRYLHNSLPVSRMITTLSEWNKIWKR